MTNSIMEPHNAIYDARQLGTPRMLILGFQHLFAMFGATVLVPLLTGLDVSVTLLFAGIGTLLFHFISKWNVPAFLGSSFAFLGGYASVKEMGVSQGLSETLALDYACLGVACAGLIYFVMAALIRSFGVKKILKYFPPIVTGPIVIAIGLVLSGSAIANCQTNWLLAIISIVTIIVSSVWVGVSSRLSPYCWVSWRPMPWQPAWAWSIFRASAKRHGWVSPSARTAPSWQCSRTATHR